MIPRHVVDAEEAAKWCVGKRFYTDLGWKIQNDYKVSVFFVPHGGSLVGLYGREGLAQMVGAEDDGTGFSGIVSNHIVRSEKRVDEVLEEARKAGAKVLWSREVPLPSPDFH